MMLQERASSTLLQRLEEFLVVRNVHAGFALLDATIGNSRRIDPHDPDAISLLLCLAQWTDLGYRDLAFLDASLLELSQRNRTEMPFLDFLRLRMVEAYRHLAAESLDQSIEFLDGA